MRPLRAAVLALAVAHLALAPAARAAEVLLQAVSFPEGARVDVPFAGSGRAPAGATLEAGVRFDGTRTRIALSWKRMKPAILFGGDVTSYVLWAVAPDGAAENLGEVFTREAKGNAEYSTSRSRFGLLVTAEPHPGVESPSEVVVFTGEAPKPEKARSEPFPFARLSGEAKPATPSIATAEWAGGEPLELLQARAVLARAERLKSGDPDQSVLREARFALAQAEGTPRDGRAAVPLAEARRATALAAEAIRQVERRRAAEEAARLEAEERAKEAARKARAEDEAERRRQAEAALAEIEELRRNAASDLQQARQSSAALELARAQLEEERATLRGRQAALEAERAALAARLEGALGKVAPTARTKRGLVVSLDGASFEAGRAALTPAARVTIGKLSGVLLMSPGLHVRVEGHTDSSGTAAVNRKLSQERARLVAELLREQGIEGGRLAFEGYGSDRPVAPNTTAAGRALNRRVEVVLIEDAAGAARPESSPAPPPEEPGPVDGAPSTPR
ncbi:MAG TPA: OmpA family protein [Thermoanaerobaculia bacterium]|nr:OmpA family protein [Thermoanaerobaculia bacterium]